MPTLPIAVRPVAIVTGASSGIGAATATRLATAGYDLALVYGRNEAGAKSTEDRCQAAGAATMILSARVESEEDCRAAVAAAVKRFGGVDALVNCAGATRYVPEADLEALTGADFTTLVGINVVGAFHFIRAASSHLTQSANGAVVNVSSDSALTGSGSSIAYAASKASLNNLTIAMARVLAPRVRVNAVCPSFADTDWGLAWQSAGEYEAFKAKSAALAPLKRMPSADDVADAIQWLVLGAHCVTGQSIIIDCGLHMTAGSPVAA